MKVLFLCRRYIPGEAWTNRVLAYAKGLGELGCEVVIYYLITNLSRDSYSISMPGVKVVNLWEKDNYFERKMRILSYLHNLFRFRSLLSAGDKVFVYGAEKMLLKASYKKHVDVYTEITEHPYSFNRKGKKGERIIDNNYRKLNRLRGVLVISKSLRDYLYSIGIDKKKVRVSNMFVDPNRFNIKKDECREPYIAYCGIVTIGKDGVDILLKAFSIFHNVHPGYKLLIIGRFAFKEDKKRLDDMVINLGIKDSVVFTGQVSPEDMPHLLVNASIMALARPDSIQAQNGFPTKLGEYLATGNPVVVTEVGEIPLFIEDCKNGYLVPPGSPELFASKLAYVAEHYEEAKAVGLQGKELVNNVFSYKSQSKVLFDIMCDK